jgi:hypothetical protein
MAYGHEKIIIAYGNHLPAGYPLLLKSEFSGVATSWEWRGGGADGLISTQENPTVTDLTNVIGTAEAEALAFEVRLSINGGEARKSRTIQFEYITE